MKHESITNQPMAYGLGALLLALGACAPAPAPASAPMAPPPPAPVAPTAAPPPPPATAAPAPPPPPAPVLVVKDVGLLAPESVLHDEESDTYLVSNVNGKPLDVDRNGFISRIGPDGKVVELKWIDGSKTGSTLDAPKGMAVSGSTLYVADITWIRLFDRKTGAPKGKLAVKGATFLNDVAVAPDGVIYVTDTGWKAGAQGFEGTGTDAVFRVDPKTVVPAPLLRDKALANPNGIVATADGVWVASSNGELSQIGKDGKRAAPTLLPKGGLDGLVLLNDGTLLASSWEGKAIYHGKPGGPFTALVGEFEGSADIGFDAKRGRLLVPLMPKDALVVYDLAALTGGVVAAPAASATPAPAASPAAAPAAGAPAASATPAPAPAA